MTGINIGQTDEILSAGDKVQAEPSAMKALFTSRNFILLWIGEAISLLGDQFYFIALPWLTLQLTGDPLAIGLVLAVAGIPRALFMLIGGSITDRFSPRLVMFASNILRMLLVLVLAMVVFTGMIQVWMLYIFALLFGLMDAFFFPAQSSILPQMVENKHLQTANAVTMMTQQLSLFGGPILAGILIAVMSQSVDTAGTSDLSGIAVAFGFDALTFFVSALTLWFIKTKRPVIDESIESESILASMKEGLRYVAQSPTLRSVFTLIIFANVLISAPLVIGIPVLADARLAGGSAAFGIIMSAFGGGTLLGMGLGGVLPRPKDSYLGIIIITVWSLMGIGIAFLGFVETTLAASLITAFAGLANGYVVIVFMTWLQLNTPEKMLGRMMSVFGFSTVGLMPVGNALMGAIVSWNLTLAFAGSGLLMAAIVLISMLLNPALRSMQLSGASAQ